MFQNYPPLLVFRLPEAEGKGDMVVWSVFRQQDYKDQIKNQPLVELNIFAWLIPLM
jgi:hypothetical protein